MAVHHRRSNAVPALIALGNAHRDPTTANFRIAKDEISKILRPGYERGSVLWARLSKLALLDPNTSLIVGAVERTLDPAQTAPVIQEDRPEYKIGFQRRTGPLLNCEDHGIALEATISIDTAVGRVAVNELTLYDTRPLPHIRFELPLLSDGSLCVPEIRAWDDIYRQDCAALAAQII